MGHKQSAMLTEQEKHEIDEEIAIYPAKQNACLEALQVVQKHRNWVSDDALKAVAQYLDMTPDELEGVATFYNLIFRKPVGRNVILMCESISCWVLDYERLMEHIKRKLDIGLGETTPDNRFTLLTIPCLGNCDHGPAMMVNENLHQDLTEERIDEILEQYN
jgi:NADH-quinone oxidoreductase subunit E